jgi:hypothetical protein
MANTTKLFTVDKFLGLNESADSTTELKMGEAARAENFYITDGHNIRRRPGVKQAYKFGGAACGFRICKRNGEQYFLTTEKDEYENYDWCSISVNYGHSDWVPKYGRIRTCDPTSPVKMFDFGSATYILAKLDKERHRPPQHWGCCILRDHELEVTDAFNNSTFYEPLYITGMSPAGGGTELEPLNLLTPLFRLQFSADGEATEYHLPSSVDSVQFVDVDGEPAYLVGAYDKETHIYTFETPPAKGVNNVEFECLLADNADYEAAVMKFAAMKHCEAYNGATDTRLFFYGDGTNVSYYTGVPAYGEGLYVPLGNEVSFDASATAITGMIRHGSQLMVFQQDCTSTLSYDAVTLADGTVTAGFYVRPLNRAVGNEMDGQVQLVNNYPRTFCNGNLYEWRSSASYYQDERYAKRISEKIAKTLAGADAQKIVTCDDTPNKTYYMFLNDEAGTVLVNRYDLDAWTTYTGEVFKGVLYAQTFGNQVMFANETMIFTLDEAANYDDPLVLGGEQTPIAAVWETGFMDFGAGWLKKYASRIWLSLLPEDKSELEVTVRTDKRDDYIAKAVGYSFLNFADMDFGRFSFVTRKVPLVKRIQIKVKKFVYYKLILRVNTPGARATVLGYDQQVRYSSPVK